VKPIPAKPIYHQANRYYEHWLNSLP